MRKEVNETKENSKTKQEHGDKIGLVDKNTIKIRVLQNTVT